MIPEIFQYDFMLRAFTAGIIIGVLAPVIGTFLVVRRLSLMASTLAHISLLGVAIGLLTGVQPVLAAAATSVVSAFGIEKIRSGNKVFGESVLALFLSGSLALAAVLISLSKGFNQNLFSYLFGSIATVTQTDLILIAGLATAIVITIILIYKELFLVSFDEELARVNGVPANTINMALIIMAAVTVSLAMQVVGSLLIGALMVIPVITAIKIGKSFRQILLYSVGISVVSVIAGLFLSYYLSLASGGTIVLVTILFFITASVFKK